MQAQGDVNLSPTTGTLQKKSSRIRLDLMPTCQGAVMTTAASCTGLQSLSVVRSRSRA